jgi:hypothetical protein
MSPLARVADLRVVGPVLIGLLSVVVVAGMVVCSALAARGRLSALVPVVRCTWLARVGPATFETPSERRVQVPAALAKRLSAYQLMDVWVLAPRHWQCEGSAGFGGTGLWAHPPGAGLPQQAVSAWFSNPGVRSDKDACTWFAAAAKAMRKLGFPFMPLSSRENN